MVKTKYKIGVCRMCGKTFEPCHKYKTYCSKKCKSGHPERVVLAEKNCEVCNKKFQPISAAHKYCSKECSKVWGRERARLLNTGLLEGKGYLSLRFQVFERDNFTCQYCGRNVLDDKVKLEVEHIDPRRGIGKVVVPKENLTTSCWECNHGKQDFCLSERNRLRIKEKNTK